MSRKKIKSQRLRDLKRRLMRKPNMTDFDWQKYCRENREEAHGRSVKMADKMRTVAQQYTGDENVGNNEKNAEE
jgi:hypothetical protein